MACALDKSQLRKRHCCFKELHKDVVSHHMWQNQEDGKKKIVDSCERGKGWNGGQESCLENSCLSGAVNESSCLTLIELLDVPKEKY